jgi:hypothetical protein
MRSLTTDDRIEAPAVIATFFVFFRQIAHRGLGAARGLC